MVARTGRLPLEAHTARPWRIHDIARDFDVLDVWALPTPGGPDDFPRLVELMHSLDLQRSSPVVHALFGVRWALGRLFDWDTGELAHGFTPMYVTDDEAALEIVNRTVHGVLHLGWVPDGTGGYRGQMAVLVKPNGTLGAGYLAAIAPFRHLIVYPTMLRAIGRAWRTCPPDDASVTQFEPPPELRAQSTLPRVEYADAFLLKVDPPGHWTAREWARAVLEGAPAEVRSTLASGWAALGLKSVTSEGAVAGWSVRRETAESLLLGRRSRIGMPGELSFVVRPEGLAFATFVHHRTPATRPMWAAVLPAHVRTVRALLERAGRQGVGGSGPTGGAGAGAGGATAGSPGVMGTFGPGA